MTNMMTFRDVEKLSAYLDGQLSRKDAARLEARLEREADLRAILEDLRRTRAVLRAAPKRRAPRNFMLEAEKARVRPPVPRMVPVLRFASVVATLLLVFTFATNFVVPLAAQRAAAPPPYGYGGGGGGGDDQQMEAAVEEQAAPAEPELAMPAAEPEATEEPALEAPSAADAVPTQAEEPPPDYKQAVEGEQPPEARVEPTEVAPVPQPERQLLVPASWQVGLLVGALVLAFLAFGLRWMTDRRWQKKR